MLAAFCLPLSAFAIVGLFMRQRTDTPGNRLIGRPAGQRPASRRNQRPGAARSRAGHFLEKREERLLALGVDAPVRRRALVAVGIVVLTWVEIAP